MFSQVIISSHPQGWGNAHKTLYPDLRVFGGHLSGVPEAPLVHQSEAILDDEAGHEAFALIQDILLIQNDEQRSQVLPEQKLHGYKLLDIYITEEQYLRFIAPDSGPFTDSRVQRLWELIVASPAGAW